MDGSSVKRILGCALAVAVAAAGVGCSNVKKGDYDEVIAENNELRGQLAAIEGERAMWLDTKSKLEQENADLAAALEQMKASGAIGPQGQIGEATMYMRDSDVVVEVAGDVLFDSGSATLKSSAKRTLDQIADAIRQQFPGNPIRVEGHSDTDPIRKSNWKSNEHLSFERALAVEKYLASRGVSATSIYSAGFGPDRPRGTKQQSRRVEIVVLGG